MNIQYIIRFYPLRGSHPLELCVLDDYYTGTPVNLIGASEPFVTEEDDSEEFFKPVRTQTGYLTIVDDGTTMVDWRFLLPAGHTSRPVILRNADDPTEVLWTGFIQHQQSETTLFEYPIERSYAVYDVLGVLDFIDFNTGLTGNCSSYVNFAWLIKRIVDELPEEVRPTNYYVQDYSHASQRLLCQVNPQLFHDIDTDTFEDLSWTPTLYKCSEVLEEICKFWGFSVHSHGTSLYFVQDYSPVAAGHDDYLKMNYDQLTTMAGGTAAGWQSPAPTSKAIIGDYTASTQNEMHPIELYDSAVVRADVGERTSLVTLFDEFLRKHLPNIKAWGNKRQQLIYAPVMMDGYGFGGVTFTAPQYSILQGNIFGIKNDNEPFGVGNQANYDYYAGFSMPYPSPVSGNHVRIEQRWPYNFTGCVLSMEAQFFDPQGNVLDQPELSYWWGKMMGSYFLNMSMQFFASDGTTYWYNGSRWIAGSIAVIIPCRVGGGDRKIYPLTKASVDPYLPAWEIKNLMPQRYVPMDAMDGPCTGRLVITIFGLMIDPVIVGGLTVNVERFTNANSEANTENEYWNGTNGKGRRHENTWESETIFASDKVNQFGLGTVLNADGTPLTTLTIHNNDYRPEEYMSLMAQSYYSKRRMVARFDLCDDIRNVASLSPARRFTFKGMQFLPISISRYWHDSIMRIVGMQVNTEGYVTYIVTPQAGTGIASVSGGGTVFDGDPSVVTCTAIAGYAFAYWQDSQGNIVSYSQTFHIAKVTSRMTLTAVAIEDTRTFRVNVIKATGVLSVSGAGEYRVGTLVNIGCVLDSDYTFTAWQEDGPYGALVSQQQNFQLRVQSDITLYPMTAYAGTDVVFRIFFGVEQPDWGYIRDDNDIVYHNGDEYEMLDIEVRQYTAVPSIGYEFDKWMLDGESYATKNPVTVTGEELLADQTLTAVFRKQTVVTEWTLTLRAVLRFTRITVRVDDHTPETFEFSNASDVFTVQVPAGAQVQLTPSYNGFDSVSFKWWVDADEPDVHETSQTFSLTMDKNKDITCVYE
jgi:hypothetical protein